MVQSNRVLIVGKSGSGKSTLARAMIARYRSKLDNLVILNSSDELSDLCEANVEIRQEHVDKAWSLKDFIAKEHSVHFEITAYDAGQFLDQLGNAVVDLGNCLFVIDEAQHFVPPHKSAPGMLRVFAEGRKRGVHVVAITQSYGQSEELGVNLAARKNLTALIVMQLSDPNDAGKIAKRVPGLEPSILTSLKVPQKNQPGEYLFMDLDSGVSQLRTRTGYQQLGV